MTNARDIALSESAEAALKPVIDAIRSGQLSEAKRLARLALDKGVEHPMLLNLRALDFEDAGLFKRALDDLRRAHLMAPRDYAILNACGLCLVRMARYEEALNCFDQALAIRPEFGPGWFNRGSALERVGEKAQAASMLRQGGGTQPGQRPSLGQHGLPVSFARRPRKRRSPGATGSATAAGPTDRCLGAGDDRNGDPAAAERRLRELMARELTPYDRGLTFGLLGDALDAQDRPAEAFAAYIESNDQLRRDVAPRFEIAKQPTIAPSVMWLNQWARQLDPRQWRSEAPLGPGPAGERGHVFLVGFPRSGTTLIESALAKHPDIVTLEERDTLREAVLAFLGDRDDIASLADASEARLRPLRDDYWARVAQFGVDARGKVFIDKNPFNTLKLPVILKLFPHAKILFAVRDPRDVVLSCFRRRFNINPSTYEFFDLARTASLYDGLMRLADTLRAKLTFAEHQIVYERLVENFEGEARAVCDFFGVDWRPDLLDFADRARRGEIASASAAQIARGLYVEGAGQWRRYRTELAPVLPTLANWVERFGYPAT